MTKVTAPLGSFSASGKIGKAHVHFSHLGRNVVRGLVTPANPQSGNQGNTRLLLGALGRATKVVVNPSDWLTDMKELVPSGQTWVSYFINQAISEFGTGNTGVSALESAKEGHTEDTTWDTVAASIGLTDFSVDYADSPNTLGDGEMLYALAKVTMNLKAANPDSFDRSDPYDTDLDNWTSSNIQAFADDMQSVA